jgi:subtilisin-like proprotein convertase family protein
MQTMRTLLFPALLLTATVAPSAMAAVFSAADNVVSAIPDGSGSGLARSLNITAPVDQYVVGMDVSINLSATSGGTAYLGDLYIYLTNGSSISVLTNRAGARTGTTFGYDDNQSMNVTFSSTAVADFHSYRLATTGSNSTALTSALTGVWGADGRVTDPSSVLDTDARTAQLGIFYGATANGSWSLFAADVSTGATHQINSWGLSLTTVPEPGTTAILLAAFGGTLLRRRR